MGSNSSAVLRQKKLFADKNIWISVLIVSIPALVLGLMAGLFAFCDQLMMVKFIPEFLNVSDIWKGTTFNDYANIYSTHSLNQEFLINPNEAIASIIRTAVAYSAPITVFINAAALLLGNGTAINYSKYNGAKNLTMAQKTWTQGFYGNLILSIFITVICLGGCTLLINLEQGQGLNDQLERIRSTGAFSTDEMNKITGFYTQYYAQVKQYASQYIYIMGAGCIFAMYSQFISLLVIAEGRQTIVVIASTVCNGLNILLDWVFIKYAHQTMIGGAVATDIGWLLNTLICFGYVIYLERRNDTNLHLKALRRINFKLRDYSELFALGLPSFVRNLSMAIATTIQVSLLVKVADSVSGEHGISDYQSIYGGVNAIANLFWTAMFGIINGARIICSYNYGARNFKRVRYSYWTLIVYALIYCGIAFSLVCYVGNTFFLNLFDISKTSTLYGLANYILKIAILQMCITAIGIGGMMIFQATGRWWRAVIAGAMQGIIYCIPLSFLFQYVAIQNKSIDLFLWCPFIVVSCSALTILIWSGIYIFHHFLDKHAKQAVSLKNVKNVEQETKLLKKHID